MKFKIAEVAIEIKDDGEVEYWCQNYGFHASQGGRDFCYGNFGSNDLERSLDLLKNKLVKDIDYIIEFAKIKGELCTKK